jgi:predicted  nucleic acid-binding Zn-ribbon protein
MGRAALAGRWAQLENRRAVTELLEQIRALIGESTRDIARIERTLTDGYAHALTLEAEKSRLQKRLNEVTQGLQRGDTAKKAREISDLAQRIDVHKDDLVRLRGMLTDLRRHADDVRVGSPS